MRLSVSFEKSSFVCVSCRVVSCHVFDVEVRESLFSLLYSFFLPFFGVLFVPTF